MFCQLGSIIFEGVKSPSSITTNEGAVYAEHALINGRPRLQATGVKLKEIALSMKLHASFCSIENELENLRGAMNGFIAMPLIWGDGRIEGNFIITDIEIEIEETDTRGSKIAVVLSVPLKEYFIKDPVNKRQQEAKKTAFAVGNKKPPVKSDRKNPDTCEKTVSNIISAIQSRANEINLITLAYTNTGRQSNDIKKHLSYMKNNCTRLISIAETAGSCASKIPQFDNDAKNLLSEINFFEKQDPANIQGIKSENGILQNRVRQLARTAGPLIKKSATRHG